MACDVCCRFHEEKSSWRPRVTEAEITASSRRQDRCFSSQVFNDGGPMIRTIPWKEQHVCYFFTPPGGNPASPGGPTPRQGTCGIYPHRPFECQTYPFIVIRRPEQVEVYVHLACPYIQQHLHTPEYAAYVDYLKTYFREKAVQRFLPGYLKLFPDYPGCGDELQFLFTIEVPKA